MSEGRGLADLIELQKRMDETYNLMFASMVKSSGGIRTCGICGLPTITQFGETYCVTCHHLLCVTCQQDGHEHNFGPPVGFNEEFGRF